MSTPRAYWTGHIRLSLVSFPVRLFAATSPARTIQLHQYDKETGQRIRYQKVSEKDEEVVENDDIVKGYEYEKGKFVAVEDEEIEKLKAESNHVIELTQFTDASDIDPIYYDRPYYIAPDEDGVQDAYVTIREALRKTKKVALGRIVIANKERIAAIKPCGDGLMLETLRYAQEVRDAKKFFDEVDDDAEIDDEQLELAQLLIEKKSKPFDPKAFKDTYQQGLMEIIKAKIAGKEPEAEEAPEEDSGNVIDIMDALRRSLEQSGGGKGSKSSSRTKASSGGGSSAKGSSSSKPSGKSSAGKSSGSKSTSSAKSSAKSSSTKSSSTAKSSGSAKSSSKSSASKSASGTSRSSSKSGTKKSGGRSRGSKAA
ncbi:Ku protein [Jiella endophytica]|uniref:Non-homologous end joining protein Ku n=1 Tax=Jiella endophytica TaxID=2558362 RepID=A0A4Y8RHT4_9HYPH|nr:Ku protein [Jiella endophytica]TFF21805.1 Ku protein [Jiella endophytica]